MKKISYGKKHRLNRCSSINNTFSILAIDHRTSLLKSLKLKDSQNSFKFLGEFKSDIVKNLGSEADSILIDPEYGAPSCISGNFFSKTNGVIISIEKSGYSGSSILRTNELLGGWDIEKTIRLGADAVKMLVYYHPNAINYSQTESLINQIIEESNKKEIPLFLEILTYSIDSENKLISDEKRKIVIESVKKLSMLEPDVLKVEFPADITTQKEQNYWISACKELNDASNGVPWVLLSASVDFDIYMDQVAIACESGSSGIAVGRAIWKDAVDIDNRNERIDFLSTIGKQRMKKLKELCDRKAKPWTDIYSTPDLIEKWHETY